MLSFQSYHLQAGAYVAQVQVSTGRLMAGIWVRRSHAAREGAMAMTCSWKGKWLEERRKIRCATLVPPPGGGNGSVRGVLALDSCFGDPAGIFSQHHRALARQGARCLRAQMRRRASLHDGTEARTSRSLLSRSSLAMFSAVISDTRVSLRHTSAPELSIEQSPTA